MEDVISETDLTGSRDTRPRRRLPSLEIDKRETNKIAAVYVRTILLNERRSSRQRSSDDDSSVMKKKKVNVKIRD